MMSAPPAGILHPATAVRPSTLSFLHPAEAARPPAISFFRLPSRRANRQAVVLARPSPHVVPRLRCSLSGERACVAQDEENKDEDEYVVVVVPPWVPSEEEVDEFLALDMSWAAIHERFKRESVEARNAVVGAVVDVLRPLRDNFSDMRSLKYVHDTEEFHIGMPFGALMTCIGLYQLWKVAPNLCLDVAMPYAFYKLSVLAADVRRRGFAPDLIIRIKLALALAMAFKDIHLKCTPLDYYVRVPVYFMYTFSVLCELSGLKKVAKYGLAAIIYDVMCFFQNSKSMFDPDVILVDGAKVDGGLMQCVPAEPDNSKLGGAMEGGETLQLLHEPAIDVEVDNSSSVTEDDKLPHLTTSEEEEDAELQFVFEQGDSSNLKEESELPQSVAEPENSRLCVAKEGGDTLQFPHEAVTVELHNFSSSVIEDGQLPHCIFKSHHEEENGELQFVSDPDDSSDLKEESEVPQFVDEPDQR